MAGMQIYGLVFYLPFLSAFFDDACWWAPGLMPANPPPLDIPQLSLEHLKSLAAC